MTQEPQASALPEKVVEPTLKKAVSSNVWQSPLLLAIVGSAGTLALAIFSNASQLHAARELEQLRLESSLILKAFEPKSENERKDALKFLLAAGFIRDEQGKIQKLVESGVPHIAPSENLRSFVQKYEGEDLSEDVVTTAENTARTIARERGTNSPVSITVIADSVIQHGSTTTRKFADEATARMGGPPNAKVPENDWLTAFLQARRDFIQRKMPSATFALRRIDELQQQVSASPTPAAR
jgi:hypothetical protein